MNPFVSFLAKYFLSGLASGLFWLGLLWMISQNASAERPKPIVIAHRGASGYLVEHSEGAKVLAHAQGADYIEQDVVMTKDLQFIVTHDITMDETTDVEIIYPDRHRQDGKWYFADFTWAEIQKLTLHERTRKESDEQVFADRFPGGFGQKVLRLEDEIQLIKGLDRTTGRSTGLYIELKGPAFHHKHLSVSMGSELMKLLKRMKLDEASDRIYLQCFELDELKRLHMEDKCRLPLVYLLGKPIEFDQLAQLAPMISGLGPSLELIARKDADGEVVSTGLVEAAHQAGMLVHPYTVRKEVQPRWSGSLDQTHRVLIDQLKVDGFFTDFPDIARKAIDKRTIATSTERKALKVYILAGQSNMQGHAKISTFEHIGMDPKTKELFDLMVDAQGKPRVCDRVWISSIGCADAEQTGKLTAGFGASPEKIGPEFTFGLTMQQLTDAPILIIKTSWGGKSLHTDFRSPSAGPYVFNETLLENLKKQGKDLEAIQAAKVQETGVYYRRMIDHIKLVLADVQRVVPDYDMSTGYELAGFVWFQGWNDMVDTGTYPNRDQPGGYDEYSNALAHLIRDVRRDLNAIDLPFVIGVLGVGGPTSEYGPEQQRYKRTHDNFRAAMAAPASLAEFRGNVSAVYAEKYWDRELTVAKEKEKQVEQKAKQQAKELGLKPDEEKALIQKMRREGLSQREQFVIEKGISNLEFHYLGSAKILGGIGKGLAEAIAALSGVL
jgi:alpha-galactosidase